MSETLWDMDLWQENRPWVERVARGRHDTTDLHEETWYIPGAAEKLVFDEEMLQEQLNIITPLLTSLAAEAHDFAENNRPAKAQP